MILQGQAVVLLDLQTADPLLKDDPEVGLTVTRGLPTGNPDFTGQGSFNVDHSLPPSTVYGKLAAGSFASNDPVTTVHPVSLSLYLPMVAVANLLPVTLHGAHVQLTRTSGVITGELHGSITESDINNIVIPAMSRSFTTSLTIDQPGHSVSGNWIESRFDTGGCTNPDGTMAAAGDLKIDVCEVAQQPLITILRTADVRIYDDQGNYAPNPSMARKDSFSFGVGFTAVGATF
jgi:hypothetical protein